MSKTNSRLFRFVEVAVRVVCVVACAGALVAASFTVDKILDINNSVILPDFIDTLNGDIRRRTEATAAVAIVASVVIPMEVIMIILRLCKIGLGAFGRIIVVADLLLVLLAFCGFGAAGVLGAITGRDWTEQFLDPLNQIVPPAAGQLFDLLLET